MAKLVARATTASSCAEEALLSGASPPSIVLPGGVREDSCTFSQSNSIDLQDNCNLQPQNFNGGLSVPFNTYGGSLSVTLESDWAGGGCVSDGNEGLHAACSSQPADWTNAQAGTPAVHTGQQHSGAFGSSCSFSRPTCWTPWQQMTCHRTASAEIDRDRRVGLSLKVPPTYENQ